MSNKKLKDAFTVTSAIIAFILFITICWWLYGMKNTFTFTIKYEKDVTATICEQVDIKYLKHPERCK